MSIKSVKLGDVCSVKGGYAFKSSEFVNNGVPVLKIANITKNLIHFDENSSFFDEAEIHKYSDYIVEDGDILIALSGATTGKYGIFNYKEKALLNQRVGRIRPISNLIVPKYLYYFMSKLQEKILYKAGGAAQPNISTNEIAKLSIPLPPLESQKQIVNVLDLAKELINKRRDQILALDEMTQSLFLEMFGDPKINPKNWPVGTIEDLSIKTQYGTSKKADEQNGSYSILRMNNITYNGGWDFSSLKYIDLNDKDKEKFLVNKGELLFNRTNSKELVGKTAVYREDEPMAFAGYLIKLICNEKANEEFISAYLNSKYGKVVLNSMAKNIVGMANINAKELKSISIYIPPKDLQDEFADINLKIMKKRELLLKGLDKLEEQYLSLLQSAFKGELFAQAKVSNL